MANDLLPTFYKENIKDKKILFFLNVPGAIANLVEHFLRVAAVFVFLFGSSSRFICSAADSIHGSIGHGNLALGGLVLGFIWPITTAMDFIYGVNNLIAAREDHEAKHCLIRLLILKGNNLDVFNAFMQEYFAEDTLVIEKKLKDTSYDIYKERVEKIIKAKLKQNSSIIQLLIEKTNEHPKVIKHEFQNEINQDWNNHLFLLKRIKIELIVKACVCFFAVLPLIAECFKYSVDIGVASNGVINYTLWLTPNIFWLGFPIFVAFTFAKLGVVFYDHINLIYEKGYDGEGFHKSLNDKGGWHSLSWYEKVYKPFTYNDCTLALSYAGILCRSGIIFSILATGTLISLPIATIISSTLLMGITLAYIVQYGVVVYKNWGKASKKSEKIEMIEAVPIDHAEEPEQPMLAPLEISNLPTGGWLNWLLYH
jgi:hypothetical protein